MGRRLLVVVCLLAAIRPAQAFVLHEDELEGRSVELGVMLRSFAFVLAGPVLRPPFLPEDMNPTGIGRCDLRLQFAWRSPHWRIVVHNQLTTDIRSHALTIPVVAGRAPEPRRWLPLQADLVSGGTFLLREVLDWAFVATTWSRVTLTVGRQPLTFGRGKIWRPADLVSSFSLTEVDAEFKPGTDALRLEINLARQTALELVAAAGKWPDQLSLRGSSFLVQLKQGWSWGEVAALLGYVRRDPVLAVNAVATVGRFELYTDTTVTLVGDESLTPRPPSTTRVVARAVLGASFKPRPRIAFGPELYASGFGAWRPQDYLAVALSERATIGELTSMGQLYVGVVSLWQPHELLTLGLGGILNPRDPSGLISLRLSYSVAASVVLQAGAHVPVGRLPDMQQLAVKSEYGMSPTFVFVEMKAAL